MSADHAFAAQMWTWPGAMIKRDPEGRVIIVNAAFLQLYGGQVGDWHGNAVSGWPAPQAPGSAARFEAKVPQSDGSEATYDWLEYVGPDGTALAIARDITPYLATVPAPVASPIVPTAQVSGVVDQAFDVNSGLETNPQVTNELLPQNNIVEAPVSESTQEALEAVTQAQQITAAEPALEPPVAELPIEAVAEPVVAAPPAEETTPQQDLAAPQTDIGAAPVAAAVVATAATGIATAATASSQQSDRAYERRPLPIEDGDAVLGNNWRDAVIAKAVGVTDEKVEDAQSPSTQDTENTETEEDSKPNAGISVLLAEDNAINALLTRTLLEAEGCEVDVVEDGQLAVEAVKNKKYDLIFMDMRMPNMDGLEATRKIRSMDHRSKGLPIVALTANAFDDDRNACFDSGMNDFMTKPVSAEELSEMVKTHTTEKAEAA